tara:strand:- start:329 stop:763 length:435 start_codon:yes stop_codon:yes gene_type:complete
MTGKTRIKLNTRAMAEVRDELEAGKKIAAIKAARKHGKAFPGVEEEVPDENGNLVKRVSHRVGLRHAKDAVEVLEGRISLSQATATFQPAVRIKKIIVEGENGDIEMDLDELQLKLLEGLGVIPMSEIAAMTELMQFLRDWGNE